MKDSMFPNINKKVNKYPQDLINDVNGWAMLKNRVRNTAGKMTTIDLDFGTYCSLNCPFCFRKNNSIDKDKHKLTYEKLVDIVLQAKELGLESIKFVGAGEPLEHTEFLKFLRFLKSINVIPLIFTKGHVLGDDKLVKKYYSDYGLTTGKELAIELDKCNASMLVNFLSTDFRLQDSLVGNIEGYTEKRNKAIEILDDVGFTNYNPTRLAIIIAPVTKQVYHEAFNVYKWARERNMYPVLTPTMMSGRGLKSWHDINPTDDDLEDLYLKVYKFNLEFGIQTLEQIKSDGISSYAGASPCSQIGRGVYITINGLVNMCPGTEKKEYQYGNIWDAPLKEIWENSINYKEYSGKFNCQCPAKEGESIHINFYKNILSKLMEE